MTVIPQRIGAFDVHHVEFSLGDEKLFNVHITRLLQFTMSGNRTLRPAEGCPSSVIKWSHSIVGSHNHEAMDRTMGKYSESLIQRINRIHKLFKK